MGAENTGTTIRSEKEARNRLVLVDGHRILLEAVSTLLKREQDLEIAGEATNCIDAVAMVEQLSPALVITDIVLPGRSGIELLRYVREARPQARTLVLTAHGSDEYVREALSAGADGYVLKNLGRVDLLQAVRVVLSGQKYLCSKIAAKVVSRLNGTTAESDTCTEPLCMCCRVTRREREVLIHVALGESNKLIARSLGVSVKAIEKYRCSMMRKLTLRNTAEVTRFALNHGMVDAGDPDSACARGPPLFRRSNVGLVSRR